MALSFLLSCSRSDDKPPEIAYVAVSHLNMRDRIASIYNKVGTLQNGERVEILDHQKRFVKVRTSRGEIGWIEQRYLADEETHKEFEALAAEHLQDRATHFSGFDQR